MSVIIHTTARAWNSEHKLEFPAMPTLVRTIDPAHPEPALIAEAAAVIRRGGLVAFPTETVYGLGANALDARAAAGIFEAKQRALNDPLIVHVAEPQLDALAALVDIDALDAAQRRLLASLTAAFWPGPLTLVLPRRERVPSVVSAGLDSVAVRLPDHPVARALIAAAGTPIAAPSANLFGHVSPTTAAHVLADLNGRIDMVLDGGPTRIGVESTVLSLLHSPPRILRPGGVTREMLHAHGVAAEFAVRTPSAAPLAPGMLDSHYAPRAALEILPDLPALRARHAALTAQRRRVGALLTNAQAARCPDLHPQFDLGDSLADAARSLYAGLHALDDAAVDVILVTLFPPGGLGDALRDRLGRAAGPGTSAR
jgi:L-threonylcarbamoyladenylate synthase